jgi:hypothetical protein
MARKIKTVEDQLRDAQEIIRQKNLQEIDFKRTIAALQREDDSAEAIRQEIWALAAHNPEPPTWISGKGGKLGSRGCPLTVWSDWHHGEVVNPDEVNGINDFNSKVSKARAFRLFDTTVDLAYNHMGRANTEYPGIIVMLGGDMIGGDIHEELLATNDRTPHQSVNDLTDILAAGIEKMASKFGKVYVPSVVGNHGRSTKKMRMKQRVFCTDAATLTLTNDLRWIAAGDFQAGNDLLAFSESPISKQGRVWEHATVTYAGTKLAKTIAITLSSGEILYVTPEHRMLVHGGQNNSAATWKSAKDILRHCQAERKNAALWTIDRFVKPWVENTSHEAGYLAAAFDGEGCISQSHNSKTGSSNIQLSFTQKQNPMLDTVKAYLTKLDFQYGESWFEAEQKSTLYIYGFSNIIRFLGEIRPPRLLARWKDLDISKKFFYKRNTVSIIGACEGGVRKIAMLSSSSRTYISAGYASHNTNYDWSIYCNLARYFKKEKHIRIDVPNTADAHFNSYGTRYMLTHGDSLGVKGGDGIIGAIGPIMRGSLKVGRSEAQMGRDFDELVICHWHQALWLPGVTVNNALKGYDEYAMLQLRAPYSRPSQLLWFNHPEHGTTARWEIFLEGKKKAAEAKSWVSWKE